MYIPTSFAETDPETLYQVIEQYSFATLVSVNGSIPTATHLPLLLDRDRGPNGTLVGHMARANPQWEQAEGRSLLAVFHGPHTYISPQWYEAQNAVPTWNYVAVHACGTLRLVTDEDRLLEIVREYVDRYEADLPEPWSMDDVDPEFIHKLLGGIVGFEISIDQIEGKWKLNQNHDVARREKVIRALRENGSPDQQEIADLMTRAL